MEQQWNIAHVSRPMVVAAATVLLVSGCVEQGLNPDQGPYKVGAGTRVYHNLNHKVERCGTVAEDTSRYASGAADGEWLIFQAGAFVLERDSECSTGRSVSWYVKRPDASPLPD